MDLKSRITHNILNVPGQRINRKVVVIESDDWGTIRMPSKEIYDELLNKGYRVDLHPYEKNDSLATEEDLNNLLAVLNQYKDINGNSPIITANCAVANPDFEKIRNSQYREYFFEPFTDTLLKYKGCTHSFDLWKRGIDSGIFIPQFHAREHLNVARWMYFLQNKDEDTLLAFDRGMMGIFPLKNHELGNLFQVAYNDFEYKLQPIENIVVEGLKLFEKIFGYKSETSIAPCYTWHPRLEKVLYEYGVVGIQGSVYQRVPGDKRIRHWMGTRNSYGQIYTIRNCYFEPTIRPDIDYIDDCLYRIKCAFRWNKPAIISSHRLNFVGSIHLQNRDNNLKMLSSLLKTILKKWPDVEFMSSNQLVRLLNKD